MFRKTPFGNAGFYSITEELIDIKDVFHNDDKCEYV